MQSQMQLHQSKMIEFCMWENEILVTNLFQF